MVTQDKIAFSTAWEQVLERTNGQVIEDVRRECAELPGANTRPTQRIHVLRGVVKHRVRREPEDAQGYGSESARSKAGRLAVMPDGTSEVVKPGPVASLDQLYVQGAAAHLLLRRKAQQLALRTQGAFPYGPRPAFPSEHGELQPFVRATDLMADPRTRQLLSIQVHPDMGHLVRRFLKECEGPILWTEMKPAGRAMDKVLKQYHGEVERLLDVSRETIVFDELQHVLLCLQALVHDPEIKIERVKNGFDPQWPADSTAGYRALCVNLRVTSQLAQGLAVDGHVCELLLSLKPIQQVVTHESHKRYIRLRDLRVLPPIALRPAAKRLITVAAGAVGLSPHSTEGRTLSMLGSLAPSSPDPSAGPGSRQTSAADLRGGVSPAARVFGAGAEASNAPIVILKKAQAAERRRSHGKAQRKGSMARAVKAFVRGGEEAAVEASVRRSSSLAQVQESREEREGWNDPDLPEMSFMTAKSPRNGSLVDDAPGSIPCARTRGRKAGSADRSEGSPGTPGFLWKEGDEMPEEVKQWARESVSGAAGVSVSCRPLSVESYATAAESAERSSNTESVTASGGNFGTDDRDDEGVVGTSSGVWMLREPPQLQPEDAEDAVDDDDDDEVGADPSTLLREAVAKADARSRRDKSRGADTADATLRPHRRRGQEWAGVERRGSRTPSQTSGHSAESGLSSTSNVSVAAEFVELTIAGVGPKATYDVEGDRTIKALPSPMISREQSSASRAHSDHPPTKSRPRSPSFETTMPLDGFPYLHTEPIQRLESPNEEEEMRDAEETVSRDSHASNSHEEELAHVELSRRSENTAPPDVVWTPHGHGQFVLDLATHHLPSPPSPSGAVLGATATTGSPPATNGHGHAADSVRGEASLDAADAASVGSAPPSKADRESTSPKATESVAWLHPPEPAAADSPQDASSSGVDVAAGVSGVPTTKKKKGRKPAGQLRVDVAADDDASSSAATRRYRSEVRGGDEIQEAGDWAAQGEAISNASTEAREAGDRCWVGLTRDQFVRRALLPGGELDERRENIDAAIADVKYFSVFETSYPIAAALSKPGFRFAILCTAICFAGYVIHEATGLARSGRIRNAKQIRFKPTETHHRRHGLDEWVSEMRLLDRGCPIALPNATVLGTTQEFIVIPTAPVDFDGVALVTNQSALDAISGFSLDAVQGEHEFPGPGGPNWRVIGGQEAYMSMDGLMTWQPSEDPGWFVDDNGVWSVTARDGLRHARVSLSPPWYAWMGLFSLTMGLCLTAVVLSLLAAWGKAGWGKRVVVAMLLVVAACLAVNAGFSVADQTRRQSSSLLQWLNAGALVVVAVGLVLREQAALGLWLYASVHFSVMHAIEDFVLHPSRHERAWVDMPILSYLFVVVGIIFLALRQRVLVNSARDIGMDMQGYREAWRELLRHPGEQEGLDQIEQAMQEWWMAYGTPNWPVLQRCRANTKRGSMLDRMESMGQTVGGRLRGLMSNGLGSPFTGVGTANEASEYWTSVRNANSGSNPTSPQNNSALSRGRASSGAGSARTFGSSVPLLLAVEKRGQSMETNKGKRDRRSWDGRQRSSLGAPPSWATFSAKPAGGGSGLLEKEGLEGRLSGMARKGGEGARTLQARMPREEDTAMGPAEAALPESHMSSGLDPFTEESSQIGWSSEEGGSLEGRSPESERGKNRVFGARGSMSSDGFSLSRSMPHGRGSAEIAAAGERNGSGSGSGRLRRSHSDGMVRGRWMSEGTVVEEEEPVGRNVAGDPRTEEEGPEEKEGGGEEEEVHAGPGRVARREDEREEARRRGVGAGVRSLGEGVDHGIVRTTSGGRSGETPQQRWRRKWLPRAGTIKSFRSKVQGASFRQWRRLQAAYEWVGTFSSNGSSQESASGSDGVKRASRKSSWSDKLSRSRRSSTSMELAAASGVQVGSLEQTYVQAAGVYAMLKDKVQVWGKDKGLCRVNKAHVDQVGSLYMPWRQVLDDESKLAMVEWAGLKKPTRAVEKLVRSYGNRVCKLLDICRQSIVFESTQDVAACLRLVAADEDVAILSIKNRLSRDYDDKETVGYRDVNINLRFRNPDAHRLGLEYHICELQLLLRSFAQLKSDRGHARYVKFRNARAL